MQFRIRKYSFKTHPFTLEVLLDKRDNWRFIKSTNDEVITQSPTYFNSIKECQEAAVSFVKNCEVNYFSVEKLQPEDTAKEEFIIKINEPS